MPDRLDRAREALHRAADVTDDATVHEQLQSIEEGLEEMTRSAEEQDVSDMERREEGGPVKTEGDVPRGDDLEEVEAKLAGLGDEADGEARELIRRARDRIDDYRREATRDW